MTMEEPLLRPDINQQDMQVFEKIAHELGLDPTMKESQSHQEFTAYLWIAYMELVPLAPRLRTSWGLK